MVVRVDVALGLDAWTIQLAYTYIRHPYTNWYITIAILYNKTVPNTVLTDSLNNFYTNNFVLFYYADISF